jgi:hypothetical protein
MAIYTTAPAKPCVIVGLIFARKGTFVSPRTRAVALAKKVGANALMLLDPDQLETGGDTTTSGEFQNTAYGIQASFTTRRSNGPALPLHRIRHRMTSPESRPRIEETASFLRKPRLPRRSGDAPSFAAFPRSLSLFGSTLGRKA